MTESHPHEEKKFGIPDSPLVVKLSIHHERPPELRIAVTGSKHNEHKDPRYSNAIHHLFNELKSYIAISGWFPMQGRLVIDPYASDDFYSGGNETALHARYPADPPPRYPVSVIDMLIRDPLDRSQRHKRNKKNAEKLFKILSEKMSVFLKDLRPILDADRFSGARNNANMDIKEIKLDKAKREAYELLGVTPDMPWDKIKKTYHDKARKAHPDAKGGVDDGSFHKLKNAYEVIKKLQQEAGQ